MTSPSALLSERPRRHIPPVSYLLAAMAVLAALIGAGGLAGYFGTPAQASALTPASAGAQTDTWAIKNAVLAVAAARAITAAAVQPLMVTVNSGQTIATIAQANCGNPADWTGIYAASRKAHLTAWNANDLTAGQKLAIQCYQNPGMTGRAYTPPAPVIQHAMTVVAASRVTSGYVKHTMQTRRSASATTSAVYHGGSGYQACVISRESGGNSQVMNSSGHYGLYQFDAGTWASGGGSAADFGHASVAEQNKVFASVYAARGTQPWSPSDGC